LTFVFISFQVPFLRRGSSPLFPIPHTKQYFPSVIPQLYSGSRRRNALPDSSVVHLILIKTNSVISPAPVFFRTECSCSADRPARQLSGTQALSAPRLSTSHVLISIGLSYRKKPFCTANRRPSHPIPRFPLFPSIIVPPAFSSPFFLASSICYTPNACLHAPARVRVSRLHVQLRFHPLIDAVSADKLLFFTIAPVRCSAVVCVSSLSDRKRTNPVLHGASFRDKFSSF